MPNILAIETSTTNCSIALWSDNKVICSKENSEQSAHSRLLTVMINDLLAENNFEIKSLNAIAVSIGPGSYTGLRIGVSVVKGLCYGLNLPTITVDTLKALTQQYLLLYPETKKFSKTLLCPLLDAKRMEVYTALYTTTLEEIKPVSAMIIDEYSFQDELKEKNIIFFGSGVEKCKNIISSPNANFTGNLEPSAQAVALLANEHYNNNQFADTAYFEPFYLKDFVAIKSTKKFF